MCRLAAYAGAPLSPARLVYRGKHPFVRQSWAPRELLSGSVNADGWGVAWYADGRPRRLAEARPIWYEADLEGVLDAVASGWILAVLRNATTGLPVDRAGLQPLTLDGWTFALNGFVPDFRARHMRPLRAPLPDQLYGRLLGVSDAETLFLRALAEVEGGATPAEALERVAAAAYARVGEAECQLTMVLGDGRRLVALRSSNVERANSLYLCAGGALAPQGVLLASERLDGDERWAEVPIEGVVEVHGGEVVGVRKREG